MNYDEDQDAAGAGLDLTFWVRRLLRYRLLIGLCFVLGAIAAALMAVKAADEFVSNGSLYVRPGVGASLTPESAFTDSGGTRLSSRDWVMNEVKVLDSPLLFKKAVRSVGVERVLTPSPRDFDPDSLKGKIIEFADTASSWLSVGATEPGVAPDAASLELTAANVLAARSSVRATPGTTVIAVSSVADDPLKAQQMTNALLDAAVELHSEVGQNMGSLSQVEAELLKTEQLAIEAEQALDRFLRDNKIFDFELQKSSMAKDLLDQGRLAAATAMDRAKLDAEVQSLEAMSEGMSATRTVLGSGGFVLNPQVAILENTIEQLRLRRFDLDTESVRMSISVPELRQRREAIQLMEEEAKNQLAQEPLQVAIDPATEENPAYAAVLEALRDRIVMRSGLKVSEARQLESLDRAQDELERLSLLEPEWRGLSAAAERKRVVYQRLLNSVSNMQAVRRLEQQKLSNLQIMHRATFDPRSVGPGRMKLVLLGAVGGLCLGLMIAFLLAFRDSRIHGEAWVVQGGVAAERIYAGAKPSRRPSDWAVTALPKSIAGHAETIQSAVKSLRIERDVSSSLIAATGCNNTANVSRAAGELAVGLSALLGEDCVFVSCLAGPSWLADRLDLAMGPGWVDVLDGGCSLDDAVTQTVIPGLSYLPNGGDVGASQRRMMDADFRSVLRDLTEQYRFVIVLAPAISDDPSCQALLRVADSVQLVVSNGKSKNEELLQALRLIEDSGSSIGCCCLQLF